MVKILISGYSYNMGGVERFILNLLRSLPKDKFIIDCLVFSDTIPAEDLLRSVSHKIIKCTPRRTNPLSYDRNMRKILKEGKYDAVWSNQCSLSDMSLLSAAYAFEIPVRILYAHTAGRMGSSLTAFLHKLNKKKRKCANQLWACSNEAWDYFFSDAYDASFKEVFPNAIFPDDFAYNSALAKTIRQKYGLEDRFVLGSIGRLSEEKNHAFVINLLPKLVKKHPDLAYVVIGQGGLNEELHELVNALGLKDHVLMTGFIENIAEHLNMFDLFLMPSKYEGLPYVLIEAQMNGLAVIAADTITEESKITETMEFVALEEKLWEERIMEHYLGKKTSRDGKDLDFSRSPFNMYNTGKLFSEKILSLVDTEKN